MGFPITFNCVRSSRQKANGGPLQSSESVAGRGGWPGGGRSNGCKGFDGSSRQNASSSSPPERINSEERTELGQSAYSPRNEAAPSLEKARFSDSVPRHKSDRVYETVCGFSHRTEPGLLEMPGASSGLPERWTNAVTLPKLVTAL